VDHIFKFASFHQMTHLNPVTYKMHRVPTNSCWVIVSWKSSLQNSPLYHHCRTSTCDCSCICAVYS